MYVESISKIMLTVLVAVVLTACGGGGGGGGGDSLVSGGASGGGTGGSGTGGTGDMTLAIDGLGEDGILAGNEFATLTATVTEDGNEANVVVLFQTTVGRLVNDSAQSTGGTASVQITGDGSAGSATVTASATLSNGVEVEATLIVQISADSPTLTLFDANGDQAETVELRAAETAVITARLEDWDGRRVEGVGVNFELSNTTALAIDITSGATDANGELQVTLTGTQTAGTGELTASATFSEFELSDVIPANGLGVNEDLNNIVLDVIDTGADGVLAGNEKTTITARVTEDGQLTNGIAVEFSMNSTGGTLVNSSAITANNGTDDGVATVGLIGDATAGTATVTASATLSNGIDVQIEQTIQTSADGPTLSLEARDAAGLVVTTFGANQVLTLEATIVDHDGALLDADDAGVNVSFDVGTLGTTVNSSDVTEVGVCPVNGIKANTDCAFVVFTSNSTGSVGQFMATATLNNIALSDDVQVTNTGVNSGSPDQDSFSITRIFNGASIAIDDELGLEGDLFNNLIATVQVDLADFFNNPVPDGTLVEFRTELGDIDGSCETASGTCSVTFTTGDPRVPIDSEVSFRNVVDDNCPSEMIVDEVVTLNGSGVGNTEYRVKDVIRVNRNGTTVIFTEGTQYDVLSTGIDCDGCIANEDVEITYRRLWLDELDDGVSNHVLANPGVASEPFLDVTSTPCLAGSREVVEEITGSINPIASTTVAGSGTLFLEELIAGDKIKVSGEVRTVQSISSNTALVVDAAFSDNLNDVSPERIIAPAYQGGLGQPYGARSTILAFALGEESFVDVNGNDEYDYGETFFDLPEVFLDKNQDGVLGDVNGDSSAATTVGPYSDDGSGADADGGKRDKADPFCYGPKTIVGDPAGLESSTEQEEYCYQDGGEEEFFIDADEDGVMDVGNGIYNGSRCLTPLQDADNDGDADDVVCTTDLVNISREVEILMAGTPAFIEFRASTGGANGGGEIVDEVELVGGTGISNTAPQPPDWSDLNATAVPATPTVQKGADVNTDLLADGSRDVELFTLANVFTRTDVTWTLSFDVERTDGGANTGDIEVFASGTRLTFDAATGATCGETDETCRVTGFTVGSVGNLIVASTQATDILQAEVKNFSITGTTTGITTDYRIRNGETVTSTNLANAALTQFDVSETISATNALPGVSERLGNGGNLPSLSTTLTSLRAYFTDRYNGRLPDGTTVVVESDNSAGCTISSVGGVAVNSNDPGADSGSSHSGTVTVGSTTGTSTSVGLTTGFGSGPLTVTVTTPSGTQSIRSITCQL